MSLERDVRAVLVNYELVDEFTPWSIPAGSTKSKTKTGFGVIYGVWLRYTGCDCGHQPKVTIKIDGLRSLIFDCQKLDDLFWGAQHITPLFGIPKRDSGAKAYSQYWILPKPVMYRKKVEVEVENRDDTSTLNMEMLALMADVRE